MDRHDDDSFYTASRVVIAPLVRLWCRYEVKGLQWADAPSGPLIVVANHVNWLDPVLIAYTCPQQMVILGKEELFHEAILGFLLLRWGMIPVRRGKFDRGTLRRALEVLSNGGVLGVFPEGRRSHGGELQRGMLGAAYLALRSGAAILPVGVIGTRGTRVFPRLGHRPHVIINIGQPFNLPPLNGASNKAHLGVLTDMIMERMAELLPESYRGAYRGCGNRNGAAVRLGTKEE